MPWNINLRALAVDIAITYLKGALTYGGLQLSSAIFGEQTATWIRPVLIGVTNYVGERLREWLLA